MPNNLVEDFKDQTAPHLKEFMGGATLGWISSKELLKITEEDAEEFLAQDPINGRWEPEAYAGQVFDNFLNNQVFYYDKLMRTNRA